VTPRISAAVAGLSLFAATFGFASPSAASSFIVDISAVSSTLDSPVQLTFDPGSYRIEWAGVAGGGLYDAYNLNCPGGVCPNSGWQNGFLAITSGDPVVSIFRLTTGASGTPATFSSALLALNAYQTSPNIVQIGVPPPYTGVGATAFLVPLPLIVNFDQTKTVRLYINDSTRADNVGGVSLRITAVPEPTTWALMIGGFGIAGGMLRRRRAVAA
jgi:hypothetical protein